MSADNIILGEGVFKIGGTAVGLTRGGGKFTVEREYKQIDADGDKGPVKGRIRLISSVAKLSMNLLEIIPANLPKLYPATTYDATTDPTKGVLAGDVDIATADYNATVTWTGKTKGGKDVVITLNEAINLENIDLEMAAKDEIVPEITFTATYTEGSTAEPWKVEYAL